MFYRPNFCCHCGEKIDRVEWSLFSSGKFCDLCQTELRAKELGPKLLTIFVLIVTVAAVSSFFRPPERLPKETKTEFMTISSTADRRAEGNLDTTSARISQSQTETNVNASAPPPQANVLKPVTAAKSADAVYYCGAATKKGTACSRRVKRPGERCWQHQGMPSVLEESGTSQK